VDRDGTINEHIEYLSDPKLFREIPGSFAALKRLRELGYRIVVVTNQPGIGLGYFSREDFFAVNREMMKQATRAGCALDRIFFCPHSKADGCACRKPGDYFLKRAEAELNVDLSQSFVIGDMSSDVQLGKNGGCRTILVKTGRGGDDGICEAKADYEASSLKEAAEYIAQQGTPQISESVVASRTGDAEVVAAITKLSSSVGHDFNTILGSILGCATLIAQKTTGRDGTSAVREVLDILRKAANRGLALSKRLIAVTGEDESVRTRKSLRSCVQAVVDLLKSTHGDECHIEVVAPSDVEVEVADFTVVQMLLELCENSLDAMQGLPERFILFHLDTVHLTDDSKLLDLKPGKYGRVSLIDHGDGYAPAETETVVRPISAAKTSGLGRELGLSMLMAQSVMKKHGGTVTLASQRKAGTNISLYFPAA
jgi:histidinol-phosphate phosphatase family protein